MEIFAKRLQELLKNENKSVYRLAKDCNLHTQTIYKWLKLETEPTITMLKIIADYFGVCADYLLGKQEYY